MPNKKIIILTLALIPIAIVIGYLFNVLIVFGFQELANHTFNTAYDYNVWGLGAMLTLAMFVIGLLTK